MDRSVSRARQYNEGHLNDLLALKVDLLHSWRTAYDYCAKKKYSRIMSFSGKKKWSLSSSHVTNGKTEVHSSGPDTI